MGATVNDEERKNMEERGRVLRHWESVECFDKFLMSPSMIVIIQQTVKHLKEYGVMKDKEKQDEVSSKRD